MVTLLLVISIFILAVIILSISVHQREYTASIGRKWVIQLDYREVDVSTSKADATLANRAVVAADLLNSKDGSSGEIDKVEYVAYIEYQDDSGAANGLDLSTPADNQHQIAVAGGTEDDLPFVIAGSKSGQHVSGDMECVGNGGGSVTLVADVSDLANSTLDGNVDQAIVHTLKDAISSGDNLRLRVTSLLIVYYNSDVDMP